MAIEVKNLIDQAIEVASERREKALSIQEAENVKGGIVSPIKRPTILCPPIILGIYLPNGPIQIASLKA